MEYEVVNNTENQQFEIFYEGHKAELVYRLRDGNIYLMHTGVPKELEGKGIASALAEYALNYGKEQKLQRLEELQEKIKDQIIKVKNDF